MAGIEEIVQKAKAFDPDGSKKRELEQALRKLSEFHDKFPFRKDPRSIDSLTPGQIFDPGSKDYFFYYLEFALGPLGRYKVGGAADVYRQCVVQLPKFKTLLRIAVDETKTIAEKVDADWNIIPGFGGDRTIVKKIIASYYPEAVFPAFKTE